MIGQGYEICECGTYAYIYAAKILHLLPSNYSGEICPQCEFWVCDVRHLTPHAADASPQSVGPEQNIDAAKRG